MAVDSEKAVGALKRRAELRRQAQEQLRKVIEDAGASSAQKTAASRALLLDTRSAKKRQRAKSRPCPLSSAESRCASSCSTTCEHLPRLPISMYGTWCRVLEPRAR